MPLSTTRAVRLGVVEEAEAVVDALHAQHLDRDADVLGRPVLAGVQRAVQPGLLGGGEGGGEGGVVDAPLHGVAADAEQQLAVAAGREGDHLLGVGRARGLVEVEDHPAGDVEVGVGVADTCRQPLPDRLDRDAELQGEAGGEEHLPVPHAGGHAVLARLVGDAVEVVGGDQAPADDLVDAEELVEVGEAEQLGRIGDGQGHAVLRRQLGDGGGPGGALDVAVQLDLGEAAEVVGGGGGHARSLTRPAAAVGFVAVKTATSPAGAGDVGAGRTRAASGRGRLEVRVLGVDLLDHGGVEEGVGVDLQVDQRQGVDDLLLERGGDGADAVGGRSPG